MQAREKGPVPKSQKQPTPKQHQEYLKVNQPPKKKASIIKHGWRKSTGTQVLLSLPAPRNQGAQGRGTLNPDGAIDSD